jgi:Spy/CpxP family protein refolding chaperone
MTRTRIRRTVAALFATAVLISVTAAVAWSGAESPGAPLGSGIALATRLLEVGRSLELSTMQKEELAALFAEAQPAIEPRVEALLAARRALFDAVHAEPIDEVAIRDAAGRLAAAEGELAVERARVVERARALLTDAQRVLLVAAREQGVSELAASVEQLRRRLRVAVPRWISLL